jgi:hypothetical protein
LTSCGSECAGNEGCAASHVRQRRDLRDQSEIFAPLIAWLRLREGQDSERADRRKRKRVAVRRELQHRFGADETARARTVLDDDRLCERFGELAGEEPRDGVGRAAGGKRHDQAQRTRGIARFGLPVCCRAAREGQGERGGTS